MKIEAYQEFGEAITKRRKALGMTQRDLAALAGCSEVFLVQLEAGKSSVRFEKLLAVLETLGLELKLSSGRNGLVVGSEI